jgi:hypothetical protein
MVKINKILVRFMPLRRFPRWCHNGFATVYYVSGRRRQGRTVSNGVVVRFNMYTVGEE